MAAQWARIRGRLQQEVGEVVYRTWLRNMTLAGVDGDEVTVVLPTAFQRDWVRMHYADRLNELWQAESPTVRRVELQAGRAEATPDLSPVRAAPGVAARHGRARGAGPGRAAGRPGAAEAVAPLDHRFLFDSFVVGKPNEFAYACARRVAERPNSPGFNPLFLYGGVGLGKTHLMHAIGLELTRRAAAPSRSPTCRPRSSCTASSPPSAPRRRWSSRSSCARVDVLMIDDIQFLIGKDSTQEEFFHTFNALVDAGGRS